MGKKLQARSPRRRSNKHRQEAETRVLVVSEGTVTEPQYFESMRSIVRSEYAVQLVVRPKSKGDGWHSDPLSVVNECIRLKDEDAEKYNGKDVNPFAGCFAVVDVDHYAQTSVKAKSTLEQALERAQEQGIQVIVSNIKFETWLLWHLGDAVPVSSSALDSECMKKRAFSGKKQIAPDFPYSDYGLAAERADRRQHVKINSIGSNPSTAMPRFFEELSNISSKN